MSESLRLPADPDEALAILREQSARRAVLVFKASPICPISRRAEADFEHWLGGLADAAAPRVARVDVIAERGLARGLTAALGIEHQSPQLLWFEDGVLRWHGSHDAITATRCAELLAG